MIIRFIKAILFLPVLCILLLCILLMPVSYITHGDAGLYLDFCADIFHNMYD